jgi:N-acetyl-gamma-glutamyl-phosphate reductase
MIRVGIVGATGYGGRELLRLLCAHPEVTISAVASTSAAGKQLTDVLPGFQGLLDITFESFDPKTLAEKCDVVFLGVPGRESMELAAPLIEAGVRVIDLGPDFRLHDPDVFLKYYGTAHTQPELLSKSVYGSVPGHRAELASAQLVAGPGCFPLSILIPLQPLVPLVKVEVPIVVDSVSGISGAGRSLNQIYHFPEMNENVRAYKIGVHQHTPEIEQELHNEVMIQFTPHVGPYTRGILSTITVRPTVDVDLDTCYQCYKDEPFVRVLGEDNIPDLNGVTGTNFIDFGWTYDQRTGNLIIVSAVDNLVGGTAGMAIQCMNVMFGADERTGLRLGGMTV